MKNFNKILFLSLIISLFFTCKKKDKTPIPAEPIKDIVINSVSSRILEQGDTLTITGENFIDQRFETKVYIGYNQVTPILLTNNLIKIPITEDNYGCLTEVVVRIKYKEGNSERLYIVTKHWMKLLGENHIVKLKYFPHSHHIILSQQFSNLNTVRTFSLFFEGMYGYGFIRDPNIRALGAYDFEFLDENHGFFHWGSSITEYTNFFVSLSDHFYYRFPQNETTTWSHYYDRFLKLDANEIIITDGYGWHCKFSPGLTGIQTFPSTLNFRFFTPKNGKGTDGYYYEFGLDFGSTPNKYTVLKSPNGFDSWIIAYQNSQLTDRDRLDNIVFCDYDLIFSRNSNNELVKSTDLGQTWQFIESDVSYFNAISRTEWYKQSGNKFYHTIDSGATWTEEYTLDSGDIITSMDIAENKILFASGTGIYIKLK